MEKMNNDEKQMQNELDKMALRYNKDFGMIIPDPKRFEERK